MTLTIPMCVTSADTASAVGTGFQYTRSVNAIDIAVFNSCNA
jgi:hypothetical protein